MPKSYDEIFESFGSLMNLLKDKNFQYLLENYERAKNTFFVGYEIEDNVSSSVLFRAGEDHDLKPEDYLIAFTKFVNEKSDEIEALKIILNKPKEWNTKVLNELKTVLKENDFKEDNIRKAHKIVYHKDLIDLISMVKHAAKQNEPLLDVNERVEQAVSVIMKGKKLTDEQLRWMDYIKEHLKQNLTIDQFDLENLPVFEQHGGFGKFKKLFKDNYQQLLSEINEAIAA